MSCNEEEIKIKNLCVSTATSLFEMSNEKGKLIFPTKSNGVKRISEQEARFCFYDVAQKTYHISVETPTCQSYTFSKKNNSEIKHIKCGEGQSGNIDLSLHCKQPKDNDNKTADEYHQPILNVEFKALNVGIHSIAKDFCKLMHENADGLFFHLLEKVNNGTMPNVIGKYHKALADLKINKNLSFNDEKLYFAICSLDPFFLIFTSFEKKDNNKFKISDLDIKIETKKPYRIINRWPWEELSVSHCNGACSTNLGEK